MSNLYRNVKLIRGFLTFIGMQNLNRIAKCQSCIGMSKLCRNVKLIKECHTCKEMSNLQWNVKLVRECKTGNKQISVTKLRMECSSFKGMLKLQRTVKLVIILRNVKIVKECQHCNGMSNL